MSKKFVRVLTYLSLSLGLLFGVISCEKDFKNVGVNIVDNHLFSSEKYISEVIAYSKNIEKNRANGLSNYLLGVQRDESFGKLEASFITQLTLNTINPDFGINAVIDSVMIELPYTVTLNPDVSGTSPNKYLLDSVWTNGLRNFQLDVYELGTFLTPQDLADPSKPKIYYSNHPFQKQNPGSPLYSGIVKPDNTDTLLVINRYKHPNDNFPDLVTKEVYKKDTIEGTNKPTLKIPLDKALIKEIFQDQAASSHFASNSNFNHFFRGLYFEATELNPNDAALINFDFNAQVNKNVDLVIFFSHDIQKDEADGEDLDGNGVNGEEDVWVRTPKSFKFPLRGVQTSLYNRDITGSSFETEIASIDPIIGEEKIYIAGAAGSHAVIKLFGNEDANSNNIPDELEELRTKNWLINDVRLEVFIDPNHPTDWIAPKRLYLYNIGEGDDEDTQLLDAMPQAIIGINGNLVRKSDGTPEKYVFLLTEYISEILKEDSELVLHDLGLKIFDTFDSPNPKFQNDTIVKKFNKSPKNLVLLGNKSTDTEKRIKLQISYSKKN